MKYLRQPEVYDPSKMSLYRYLAMDARGDIRNALQSLDALEQEFLGLQLILPDDVAYKLYFPLARARARLWRAITQLEEAP